MHRYMSGIDGWMSGIDGWMGGMHGWMGGMHGWMGDAVWKGGTPQRGVWKCVRRGL